MRRPPGCRLQQIRSSSNNYQSISFIAALMEADIAQKQQFLFREIIEGGYSPEEFQEFLQLENPDSGMNLELWTLPQLKDVTNKFKRMVDERDNEGRTTGEQESSGKEEDSPVKTRPSDSIMYTSKHENYSNIRKCTQSKLTSFYNSSIQIYIDGYEKKEGGVFEKSFYTYKVKFSSLKGMSNPVYRRYSDFEWLRDTLMILHPNLPIPPVAKKGKMRRTQDKHLLKRMYILEKFLNKIVLIPDVRADSILENFLTLDTKDFEKEKGKYKKLKTIAADKIETVSGELELMLGETSNTFISRSQKYVNMTQPELKTVYKDFKGAATMLENCSAYLKKIGNNCHTMSVNFIQFRKECGVQQTPNNLFSVLEEMTSRYSELLTEQAKTFRKQIYSLIKYESYEMLNMIECYDRLASLQQSYIDQKMALLKRKEKLYEEGNMSKWGLTQKISNRPSKEQALDLMLPKETKQLTKQRDLYAAANAQVYHESLRLLETNDKYLSHYLEEIIKMESDVGSRSIMIWADVLAMVGGNKQ